MKIDVCIQVRLHGLSSEGYLLFSGLALVRGRSMLQPCGSGALAGRELTQAHSCLGSTGLFPGVPEGILRLSTVQGSVQGLSAPMCMFGGSLPNLQLQATAVSHVAMSLL